MTRDTRRLVLHVSFTPRAATPARNALQRSCPSTLQQRRCAQDQDEDAYKVCDPLGEPEATHHAACRVAASVKHGNVIKRNEVKPKVGKSESSCAQEHPVHTVT